MATIIEDDWMPAQATLPECNDLRGLGTGPKGYKERNEGLKRKMQGREEDDEEAEANAMDEDDAPINPADLQSSKRRKAEGAKYIPVGEA